MNYCVYCRNPFEPDVSADTAKEVAICLECGEITVRRQRGDSDKTLERCFSCFKEVTLAGYFCLWCGAGIRDAFTVAVNKGVLQPSPFRPRWQISHWVGEGAGSEAPFCPRCSQRIRRDDSPRPGGIGYSNPPWNAGWDGSCEHCQFRFDLSLETPLHFQVNRSVRLRPQNCFYRTFVDEGIHLSGVEIIVTANEYSEPSEQKTIFLAMGEIAQLIEALQGYLSVWLEQYDWSNDWT